jgi:hypothetical protein
VSGTLLATSAIEDNETARFGLIPAIPAIGMGLLGWYLNAIPAVIKFLFLTI